MMVRSVENGWGGYSVRMEKREREKRSRRGKINRCNTLICYVDFDMGKSDFMISI